MSCRHALHVGMIKEATDHMPALVVHRVYDTECGHRGDELHPATWAVVFPGQDSLRQVRMCDRHFALFILDREQFEQIQIPIDEED
jgi:hypothetical protein